ncbi:MAG TPA: cytochrome c biogenesis protein CcdA [Candidatus Paceibacterota bacterium]
MLPRNLKLGPGVYAILAGLLVAIATYLKFGSGSTNFIWNISEQGKWLLPLVASSALIDSINPCAFSVLLLTVVVLVGLGKSRGELLRAGLIYIGGLSLAYFLIGLGLLQALHIFSIPHFMGKLAALVLVLIGLLSILSALVPKVPQIFKIPEVAHRKIAVLMGKGTLPALFFLGMLVGLCEFPCTGGPYLAILGLLHDTTTYLTGVAYLLLYNAIFILPLVVILFLASRTGMSEKLRAWQRSESKSVRVAAALAMVVLGIIIFLF